MRAGWLLLSLLGCSEPTTILVDARLGAGEATPATLAVSVFDARGVRVANRSLEAARLPGTLIIAGLPDDGRTMRVVLRATGPNQLGWARVPTVGNAQVRAAIELSSATADSDGDGVPDPIDVCPSVGDPQQTDSDENGVGDACSAGDLGVSDLASGDLAGGDLGQAADAGGASKCPGTFLLCDGFENGFNSSLWTKRLDRRPEDGGAPPTIDVDTTHVYRGTHSLRSSVGAVTPGTYLQVKARTDTSGVSGGTMFIRAFYYVSSAIGNENPGILSVEQEAAPFGGMSIDLDNGGQLVVATYTTPAEPNYPSAAHLPLDRWVCVEWEIDQGASASTGSTRVWLDDVEVSDLHLTMLTNTPFYGSATIGFELTTSSSSSGLDLWMDEIAIDTARIGCSN